MNKFLRKTALMSGVTFGALFTSCQEQELSIPIQPVANNVEKVQAPPLMTPDFKLTKFGDETLSYHADGRIKQVNGIANANVAGYSDFRVDYEYDGNTVIASRFEDNVKDFKMEWHITNGRAEELTKTSYHKYGGAVISVIHAAYQYNAQNQLVKVIITEKEKKTMTLSYDNLGNVVKLLLVRNTKKGDEFENLMKYEYNEYVGGPVEMDKGSIINQHVFCSTLNWIGDPYLPIFGKLGKNLLKKSVKTGYAATYKYAYTLDINGYVKEFKTLKNTGELLGSKQLIYAVPVKNRF